MSNCTPSEISTIPGKTVNVLLTQLRSPDEMQVTNTEGLRGMEAHFTLPGIALFKPRRPLRFNGS